LESTFAFARWSNVSLGFSHILSLKAGFFGSEINRWVKIKQTQIELTPKN
jgi:hypothetical protein